MTKGMTDLPLIHVVGIGMTGADSLSPAVRALVESAAILVGGQRHLEAFDYLLKPPSSVESWPLGDFSQTFEKMRSRHQSHPSARIVVLTSGDPLFFGLGRLLLANFPPDRLTFHPHISAIQLAFSRLKLPWQDATLLSVHGRSEALLLKAIKRGDTKIALLTDSVMTPGAIARLIIRLDVPIHYQMWVCENLGDPAEHIAQYSLDEARAKTFAPLNVVVLRRQPNNQLTEYTTPHQPSENLPLIGLPDSVFQGFPDRPMLITKKEIRLLILGELAPLNDQVIWDIGAGTGSLSIELSRLCPTARLYAIEKTAIGAALIEKNAQRLALAHIEVIHGSAPAALKGLPQPHRVFIGGSGGELLPVLTWLSSLHQAALQPCHPMRIVIALATVEHLSQAIAWATQSEIAVRWTYHLTQINVARSIPVGSLTRLSPLNPVTLITLQTA